MAFTEAQLQAQLNTDGLCARIIRFDNTSSASYTDVGVQNLNGTSAKKTGYVQIAQSNTAAQAATAIRAALS